MIRSFPYLAVTMLVCLAASFAPSSRVLPAAPGADLVSHLQDQLGLSQRQAKAGLGALLVYARERLPEPQFNQFVASIPNADQIMQDVKQRGIVTRPLDDKGDYETALANIGLAPQQAAQFGPAVLEYLQNTGHDRERDILRSVF